MTIRGKVLLLLAVATGLMACMGRLLRLGVWRMRLHREWVQGSHEQRSSTASCAGMR